MSIPCRSGNNKLRVNPAPHTNGPTTVACGTCGLSFTGPCGREAWILLIKHLGENMADPKHRAEFHWAKNEVLSMQGHRGSKLHKFFDAALRVVARLGALILIGLLLWAAACPEQLSFCQPSPLTPFPPCSVNPAMKVLR
jgi:hypothetical protein